MDRSNRIGIPDKGRRQGEQNFGRKKAASFPAPPLLRRSLGVPERLTGSIERDGRRLRKNLDSVRAVAGHSKWPDVPVFGIWHRDLG